MTTLSTVHHYALRGSLVGMVSGFGFVLLSLGLIFWQNQWQLNLVNLINAHLKNWAQWVVDCAPVVLGSVGYFLGRYIGLGKTENFRLENAVKENVAKLLNSRRELQTIHESAQEIALASRQVASAADMLNDHAMEQAALVQETGTALGEIFQLIESNAKNALETDKIANHAMQTTTAGAEGILRAVRTMQTIIEKVHIVQEIAKQTNLLALNATIEAARAGEHGRGFAVVASEIGKLAGTSNKAAKQIQNLVNEGSSIAESTAEELKQIVTSMQETAHRVMAIRNASTEQSEASQQISESVARLNQIAEQTASAAEQLAATADEMNSQTSALLENLKSFQSGNLVDAGINSKTT